MSQSDCLREAEVLKAVRTGMWEQGVSTHVAGCPVCKEIVEASQKMQAFAHGPEQIPALPDARLVWWKAQLTESQARTEKAQEFLEWWEIISATVISAGLAGWIAWNWYAIPSLLTSTMADVWPQFWAMVSSSIMNSTPPLFSIGGVILAFVVFAIAYPSLAQD